MDINTIHAVPTIYGSEILPSDYTPLRSFIAEPELSPAGNVIVRVGREHHNPVYTTSCTEPTSIGGWSQTEHVVLTRDEAIALANALLANVQAVEGDGGR